MDVCRDPFEIPALPSAAGERWARACDILNSVLQLPAEQRGEFLQQACGSDVSMRQEVDSLLAAAGGGTPDTLALFAGYTPGIPPPFLTSGERLAHYEIRKTLGQGGMGVVYEAFDSRLQRMVALKCISGTFDDNRERLGREARAASALNHPNIVTIYEYGSANDVDFIAMEYIDGVPLENLLGKRAEDPGTDLILLLGYAKQVASAMARAHEAGIVHRDLKPGNVMITAHGIAKVLDFGLAKREWIPGGLAAGPMQTGLTVPGMVMGTPSYLSPEQAMGESADSRADVFAFGIILYEIVCGTRPFVGANAHSVLHQIVAREATVPDAARSAVPASVCNLIERCLHKDREQRLRSMAEAASILAAATSPESVKASGAPARMRRRPTGNIKRAVMVVALATLVFIGAAFVPRLRTLLVTGPVLPKSSGQLYQEGQAWLERYDRKGYTDNAIASFQHALEKDGENVPALAGLAEAFLRKRYESPDPVWVRRALDTATRAVQLDGLFAAGHAALGNSLLYSNRVPEALAEYEKAIGLDPRSPAPWRDRGVALERQHDYGEAETSYRKAIELAPTAWQSLISYATFLQSRGRTAEAIARLETARQAHPDNARVNRNLGVVYYQAGRREEAAAAFQKAIEVAPSQAVYSNLGTALFYMGRYGEAAGAFEKASRMDANSYIVWMNLGDAYRWTAGGEKKGTGALRHALQLLERDLEGRPHDPDLLSTSALLRAKLGSKGEALAELAKLPESEFAGRPFILNRLAVTHELCGQRQKALDFVFAALQSGYPVMDLQNDPELLNLRRDPEFHRRFVVFHE